MKRPSRQLVWCRRRLACGLLAAAAALFVASEISLRHPPPEVIAATQAPKGRIVKVDLAPVNFVLRVKLTQLLAAQAALAAAVIWAVRRPRHRAEA